METDCALRENYVLWEQSQHRYIPSIPFYSRTERAHMLQPSEVIAVKLLPTIRARLAQTLLERYRMKQTDVARALGLTQAAVSHYNTKSRGLDHELLRRFPEIDPFVEDLAARIHDGLPRTEQVALITRFSVDMMNTQRFCKYHKKLSDLDPNCAVCFPTPPPP